MFANSGPVADGIATMVISHAALVYGACSSQKGVPVTSLAIDLRLFACDQPIVNMVTHAFLQLICLLSTDNVLPYKMS